MKRTLFTMPMFVAAFAAAGVPQKETVPEPQTRQMSMMKNCSMMVADIGTVTYESVENGVRLTLTPKDPAKLDEFRAQLKAYVERINKGECSMMGDMMRDMMQGMKGRSEPKPDQKEETDHSSHHSPGKP